MKLIRKHFSSKKEEKEESKEKAAIAGTGSILTLGTTKTGRLTGKVTRYHNTEKKNVDNILKEGIKAKYAEDPKNLTNTVLSDVDPEKKKGLVYTAKKKSTAENVGKTRQMIKEGKIFPNPFGPKDHQTLKLEFDYDEIKGQKRIKNPELRGAKNAKEFYERRKHGLFEPAKYKDLDAGRKILNKKAYDNLNEGTHIFRGDIDSSHIVGGKGYKGRTMKQVKKYIKNNPGRFGKEAAKVGTGVALGGYAIKKGIDSSKKDSD